MSEQTERHERQSRKDRGIPEFTSQVPVELLHGKPEDVKWLYQQQSIQKQLLEFICTEQAAADESRRELKEDMKGFALRCEAASQKLDERLVPLEEREETFKALARKKGQIVSLLVGIITLAGGTLVAEIVMHAWPHKAAAPPAVVGAAKP